MLQLAVNGGTPVRSEPFPPWPLMDEKEREAVQQVILSGKWGYPQWECVPRFEKQFAAFHDARFGVCFNSGTSALLGALWAAGVQPGEEVILPAYTFIATATAVLQLGAVPVFADIDRESFHLSARSVEDCITPRTAAVVPVHIGGRPADMTRLGGICDYHNVKIIEDAAQAWGAEWRSRRVGALGSAGIFSFQSSKNITAGEGGIVLTNDEELAAYCRSYCNCGRLEDKPRYEHFYLGGNYRLGELHAAVLQVQFERYPVLLRKRQENAAFLNAELAVIPGIVPVNQSDDVSSHAYHLFLMRYKKEHFKDVPKDTIIEALQREGIPVHPGYTLPVYRQPVFASRAFGSRGKINKDMPDYGALHLQETETACREEGMWLTQNVLLGTEKDMQDIVDGFAKVQKWAHELT